MIVLPLVLGSAVSGLAPVAATDPGASAEPIALPSLTAAALQEEAAEEADGLWHGNINIGLSRSEGNADIESYSLDARGVREFEQHRYTLEALWLLSRDNDRTDDSDPFLQRRALGSAKYDQFFTEKSYVYLNTLVETNLQALLDLRWVVGGGLGQQWRDDEAWKISTEVGLAYFNERFDNDDEFEYLAARVGWDVWARVTESLVFGTFGEVMPSLDDKDDIYGRATTYFETSVSENMTARAAWIAVYDNTPTTDADGNTLERLDSVYLITLGWTF